MNTPPSKWRYWTRFHLPNLIYLLLLITIAGGSYWLVKNNSDQPKQANNKKPELVNSFANGLEVTRTGKNGNVDYQVSATDVLHYGTNDATVKNVKVIATPKDGGATVTATATDGVWDDENHKVALKGAVVIDRTAEPESAAMHLETESLDIDLYNNLATTKEDFKFIHGQSVATGKAFEYDYATRDLHMGGQPNSRLKATFVNENKKAKTP